MNSPIRILQGDAIEVLRTLPDESAHTCVTSPPYWGLRDYGVAGQLGLEKTPEAYVEAIVGVFREVRRVLRDDGTLWLNIGDSYASGTKGSGGPSAKQLSNAGSRYQAKRLKLVGIKPKDLVGIPWRVAFALQQPYYSGRIKRIEDRIWLAAMIDAEGCLFIHKRKAGQNNGQGYQRQNDNYGPGLEIANTSEAVVLRCMEIVGAGSVCSQSPDQNNRRKQTIYRWNLRTTECRDIVREVYPHLVAKQQQARILCGCPSSGDRAEAAHAAIIGLHRGIETDVDFPVPESMFQPGFYLRSDIIWSKLNPMPESVTDRPTKAHEYIFLLSKSERYAYDADAIAESVKGGSGWERSHAGRLSPSGIGNGELAASFRFGGGEDGTRNKRTVWTVSTCPTPEAHFATYPPDLIEPCILAGSPPGGTVLDPFTGAGTTGLAALKHGREFLGVELNPEYIAIAEDRFRKFYPLLAGIPA